MAAFEIDPDSLRGSGCRLGDVAQQMTSGLQQLQATVTGSGNPWGGDEQGSLFAVGYAVVLGKALESMSSQARLVDTAGAGLVAQADLLQQTEDVNVQQNDTLLGGS